MIGSCNRTTDVVVYSGNDIQQATSMARRMVTEFGFSKKFFVRDSESSRYKAYDGLQFALKKNSYKIYGLSGALYSLENLDHCLRHKESVEKEISDIFKDLKKFSTEGIHPADPSGKSYHHQTQYTFAKGGVIAIECVDWSEEMKDQYNWWDNFSITIYSKEYEKLKPEEKYSILFNADLVKEKK